MNMLHHSFSIRAKSNFQLLALADAWIKSHPEYIVERDIHWEFKLTGTKHILLEVLSGGWKFEYVIDFKLKENTTPAIAEHINTAPLPVNSVYAPQDEDNSLTNISEMLFYYYSNKGIENEKFETLIRNGFMLQKSATGTSYKWSDKAHDLALRFKKAIQIQ